MRLNSFSETEKFLKRCLKGKIDINKGIVIIFLMTGMIGYHNVSFSVQADTGKISYQQGQGHSISGGLAYGDSNSIAIGSTAWKYDAAHASGSGAIAVGTLSKAAGSTSVAVGYNSTAKNNDSLAIGYIAQAIGSRSIAFGGEAIADSTLNGANADSKFGTLDSNGIEAGTYSVPAIAIGSNSKATNRNTIAIGTFTKATGNRATALGSGAEANGEYSLAGGYLAKAEAKASIAIGEQAFSKTENSIVLGTEAKTSSISTHTNAVAIGNKAAAEHGSTIAIGNTAKATALQATAIGSKSEVSGDNSVAIGQEANSTGTRAVSLGVLTKSTADRTVAIGNASEARASDSMAIGSVAIANGGNSIALGKSANAIGNDSIVLGASSTSSSTSNIAIGDNVRVTGEYSLAIGSGTNVTRENSIAIGRNSSVSNQGAVAIGLGSETTGERAITLGNTAVTGGAATKASAKATDSVAIGNGAVAEAGNSLVLGLRANAMSTATNGVALGTNAKVEGNQALAIGSFANAKAIDSIAIGTNAVANLQNSVAIGNTSVTTAGTKETTGKIGEITYGDFAGALTNTNNVVSVGGGRLVPTRQIKNVAAGKVSSDSTDAINGSQLYATNNVIGNMAETLKTQVLGGNAEYEKAGDTAGKFTYTNIGETGKDNIHDAILASRDIVAAGTNIKDIKATTAGNGQVTYTVNAKGAEVALKDGEKNLSLTPNTDETTNITKYTIGLSATPTFETVNATNMYVTNVDESRGDSVTNKTYVDEKVDAVTLNTAGDNSTKGSVKLATQTLSVTAKATGDIEASTEAKDQGIVINIDSTAIDKKTTENATNITNNKNEINKLGENTIKLSSDSGDTETQNLSKDGGLNFKIAGVDGVTTEASGDTVKVKLNYDKVAENTPLTYKANGGNAQTTTLAKGLNFVNGDKTVATVDAAGVVKYDLNDETKTKIDNSMSSFKIKANSEAEETVSNGETVTFANGDNIEITRTGKTITVGTSKDITATTVNATNMTVTNVGDTDNSVTNKKYVDDKVGAVTLNTVGTTGEGSVKLKDQKLSVTTNTTGDITANTVANNQGIVINIDSTAIDNKITENTTNITEVKELADKGLQFGANSGETVTNKLGSEVEITGSGTKEDEKYSSSNVKTKVSQNTDGKTTIEVMLDKDLTADTVTVGEKGADGKDGVDGKIGVNGKDGSAVVINGADGSIGLNGKDGANGLTIKGANGTDGVDGKNGTDGKTRIIYEKPDGTTEEVATLNDGMKYGGDTGDVIKKKLNEQVSVVGGVKEEAKLSTEDNLGVISDGSNNLTVRLAKDLKGITSISNGDTKITLGDNTINVDGAKITNVAKGTDPTDAVNVSQLTEVKELASKGFDITADDKTALGTKTKDNVAPGELLTFEGDSNITTHVSDNKIEVKLNKDLKDLTNVTVGEKGANGKDGVDGKIGVNGKDGSAVVINGADGSIGLNGKDGANGLTIKGANGADGVDGKNGTDGKTRIVYEIENPDGTKTTEEVATLNDGLRFAGNDEKENVHKLNSTVRIVGEGVDKDKATNFESASGNIAVVSTADDTLTLKLAKELKEINSVSNGDTKIVLGDNKTINIDGARITNVASPTENTDATNKEYVDSGRTKVTSDDHSVTVKHNEKTNTYDLSVDTSSIANTTKLTYKANGGNAQTTTLAEGLNFVNTTNITASVDEKGVVTHSLNKDLKDITSISNGDTKIILDKDGEGNKIVNVDGAKITNVANGEISETSTDAVNGSQLHSLKKEITSITGKGFNISADNGVTDNVALGETVKYTSSDKNVITKTTGNNEVDFTLNDKITLGEDKTKQIVLDSETGSVSVGDKVTIDGTTGDSKFDKVEINGKEGTVTGLTNTEWDVENPKAVSGRAATEDQLKVVNDKVNNISTTINDELGKNNVSYGGDTGDVIKKKLNEQVNIVGGIKDEEKLSKSPNVGVVSDGSNNLTIRLAKDLKDLSTITLVDESGNKTTINNSGMTISTTTADGTTKTVSLTENGLNNGGNKITNVAAGEDETDAVNVSQLNEVKNVVNNHADAIVNNAKKIDKLDSEMRHGFANAAAMATLKYMEIGVNQVTVGAALGTYKGTQAVAVGVQGAPTEDTRVHAQVSVSPGRNSTETMAGIGAAWRFNVK